MNVKKLHLGKGKPKELHKKAKKVPRQMCCLILEWQIRKGYKVHTDS